MEWVEVTAKTVEEAKDAALDQLGVDETDAEFEVLEEPKAGLFGLLRSQARVRARVLPAAVRPKVERRERRRPGRSGGGGSGAGETKAAESRGGDRRSGGRGRAGGARPEPAGTGSARRSAPSTAPEEGAGMIEDDGDAVEVAEEFLTGLLAAFGARSQVERRVLDDDTVELAVTGDDLGLLIGPRGQTLAALQELTRTVVQRRIVGHSPRLMLDVAGYRQARREALERFTRSVADQVRSSGTPVALEPMPAPDRKVVHDTANALDGVSTTSEGEDPDRRVVILPQD
ncbi:MAG: Jag N-terminal domain-containing protein [Actinomycetota bacterium]|nr:Jag N-terminal domain-containing protein [Actinomycetota bacterium]